MFIKRFLLRLGFPHFFFFRIHSTGKKEDLDLARQFSLRGTCSLSCSLTLSAARVRERQGALSGKRWRVKRTERVMKEFFSRLAGNVVAYASDLLAL